MNKEKAQSLIELSLYGMVVISLLGVVLSYGMKYNFRQVGEQRAFRKAMAKAYRHFGSKTYVLVHDRSVPNPMDSYAAGDSAPGVYSATVMRDYEMLTTPDIGDQMPTLTIGFESGASGTQEINLTTAETWVYSWEESTTDCSDTRFNRRKYELVLGDDNVWGTEDNSVSVIDYCGGQTFDYDGCKKQCRMMQEVDFCISECRRSRFNAGASCNDVCNAPAPVFWYCNDIDNFFAFTGSADTRNWYTGIQPDMTSTSTRGETMHKVETPGGITSTDVLTRRDTNTRTVVYRVGHSAGATIDSRDNAVDRAPTVTMTEAW